MAIFNLTQMISQKINEELNSLAADYQVFPEDSLQRSLQVQIIFAHCRKYNTNIPNILLMNNQKSSFKSLKNKFLEKMGSIPEEINSILKGLQNNSFLKDYLVLLKSKIMPIDILQLERLINKTLESAKLIQEKDVILFIGNTGSGKSTAILKFLGYQLKQGQVANMKTLLPTKQLLRQHKTFYTSPETKSCTKYINAVQFPKEMYPKGISQKQKNLFICDSPGFGDTDGFQVDISNGIGMINALMKAKSVRIVAVLPYDSLTADRLTGAIKIGQIIGNLFNSLDQVKNSIFFLFNKVPKSDIKNLPKQINNKILHLKNKEKSDQRLKKVLQCMLQQSEKKVNFYFPLEDNQKQILQSIIEMQKIKNPRAAFRHQFLYETKKQIQNCYKTLQGQVKDYLHKQKLKDAQFYLKLLLKLKNILKTDTPLLQCYNEVAKLIEKSSEKQFNHYQQLMKSIIDLPQMDDKKEELRKSRERIMEISTLFAGFDNISVVQLNKVNKIHQQAQNKLFKLCQDPKKITQQTISAVKMFSDIFKSQLANKVVILLQKQHFLCFNYLKRLLKQKNYEEMIHDIKQLANLTKFAKSIHGKSTIQISSNDQKQLKQQLKRQVFEAESFIEQKLSRQQPINQSIVLEIKKRLKNIKLILALNYINNKQAQQKLAKSIQILTLKCKQMIKDLQVLKPLLEEEKISFDKNMLISLRKQIQLMLQIDEISANLNYQFKYALQKIKAKNAESVQKIRSFVRNLKNHSQQIYKKIESIKNSMNIFTQYCWIVDQKYDINAEINPIKQQFLDCLSIELKAISKIEVQSKNIQILQLYYQKIKAYKKIEGMGQEIKQNIQNIEKIFLKKLKSPFESPLQQCCFQINDKNYKSIIHNIGSLQKLSQYSLKIQQLLSPKQYEEISQDQVTIRSQLKIICSLIKQDVKRFAQISLEQEKPSYLTDLLKVLIAIRKKPFSKKYLRLNLSFNVDDQMSKVDFRLQNIKQEILQNMQNFSKDLQKLQLLLTYCTFYAQKQKLFAAQQSQKYGFKTIFMQCQSMIMKSLKNDEQKIEQALKSQPLQIDFQFLKNQYEKFINSNQQQGKKKAKNIVNRLKSQQNQVIKKYQTITKLIDQNQQKTLDLFSIFQQLVILQEKSTIFYNNCKIGKNMINNVRQKIVTYYFQQFSNLRQTLQQFNEANYLSNAKKFSLIQNQVFRIFRVQQILKEKKQIDQPIYCGSLLEEIKEHSEQLKQIIQNHLNITIANKKRAKNIIKLKTLLDFIQKGKMSGIRQKYLKNQSFIVDKEFKQIYQQAEQEVQIKLKQKVNEMIRKQQRLFQKQLVESASDAQKRKKKMDQVLEMLPKQFQKQHEGSFKKIEQAHNERIGNQIQRKIQNIADSRNMFFVALTNLSQKNQFQDYNRFVDKFKDLYTSAEQKYKKIVQKLQFMQQNFVQLFKLRNDQIKQHEPIFKIFKNRFEYWHQQLMIKETGNMFNCLNDYFQSPLAEGKKKIDIPDITRLFEVYIYFVSLQQMDGLNIKNIKNQFIAHFRARLKDCFLTYNKYLENNRPAYNLSSEYVLTLEQQEKIKQYSKGIKQVGFVMDHVISQIEKSNPIQEKKRIGQYLKNQLNILKNYRDIFQVYNNQVYDTKMFLKTFVFFDDNKRNMSPQGLLNDLNKLNAEFKSLRQKQTLIQQIIDRRSIDRQISFTFNEIKSQTQAKFDDYIRDAIQQVKEFFTKIDTGPIAKINLLRSQLQIIKQKKSQYIFISQKQILKASQQVKNIIDSQMKKAMENIKREIQSFRPTFLQIREKINQLYQKQKNKIQEITKKYNNIQKEKTQIEKKKAQQALDAQTDENVKINIKNNETVEINSIKNECEAQKNKEILKTKKQFQNQSAVVKNIKDTTRNFCRMIVIFQKALIDIIDISDNYKKSFDQILKEIKSISIEFVKIVQSELQSSISQQDPRCIGRFILINYSNYFKFGQQKIKKLIKGQDIHYVLKNIQKIFVDGRNQLRQDEKNIIFRYYQEFKRQYEFHKQQYIQNPTETTIIYMVTPLKELGKKIKNNPIENSQVKDKIKLLAGIFALWVILKSEKNQYNQVQFTIEPHPTQITTLILLLGICQKDNPGLCNRLAQVGTGEGKSIVLAGLCSYLALIGYNVRCACYSVYLSGRDSASFKQLFMQLGVQNKIKYGTFNELCEDILNSGEKTLKQQMENLILQPGVFNRIANAFAAKFASLMRKSRIKDNPSILVIDEVDVFFEESFFSKSYCPAVSLQGDEVKKILEHIWKQVQSKGTMVNPNQIINSQAFKNLKNKFQTLGRLLENQIHGMIAGALNYKHDYSIIDKKICYKDGDGISHTMNYGYKTVFANLYEYEKGSVSKYNLDKSLQISLMFAQFSYAQLPSYFQNILGVTGTLQSLPKYKKKILEQRYHIEDQYAIPSAFGINDKRVQKYTVTLRQQHYKAIINKINEVKNNRPIIIFFKGPKELNEFANSEIYKPYMGRTYNLTQFHDASTRDQRIVTAVNPNNITLMSSAFGRGTDFVLLDDKINQHGGLHIIHAFLSLDESEEIQIKGRTARQNSKGSYDCIISQQWLEELDIQPNEMQVSSRDIYKRLFLAREQLTEKLSQSTLKMLDNADRKHKEVFRVLAKSDLGQADLINYIYKINEYPLVRKLVIKTILALDATGSMSSALKKTCLIIRDAFERSYAVLAQKSVEAAIQVKIKIYRNYNSSHEQILQGTAFQNTPVNLKNFLEKVYPEGGWGNEALEVLFQSLNKQNKIDQVILIGDAPPNTKNDVERKRQQKGEMYWIHHGFPKTYINQQLQVFRLKNCPVHSFYLNSGEGFIQISQYTNGASSPFNILKHDVTEDLAGFIVQNILKLVEKQTGRYNLVQAYRKMYMR